MTTTMSVPYKRKRAGITDYRQRLKMLQSRKPRLVVRKTSHSIIVQLVEYTAQGDHVITGVHSTELKKYGWLFAYRNLPSAYLAGILLAHKAKKKAVKEAIVDIGLQSSTKGSRLYAALQGVLDGGFTAIEHSKENLPPKERIYGKHISSYTPKAQGNQFAAYKKAGVLGQDMSAVVDKVKEAIQKSK